MRRLLIILALFLPATPSSAAQHRAAPASKFVPVVATLGERASGFANLAECEEALLPGTNAARAERGSVFNRAHGNSSRCEMIEGEPMIVVIPRDDRRGAGGGEPEGAEG